ncbi:MAG: hypothetical protein E7509_06460 [Ruminococcus sp.]|nr:hypothetical protein [Ruminococcus sp.]
MAVTTKRNVGKTIWIIFIIVIMIIIAGLIVTSLVFKNKDVTPSVFGYSVFIVDEDGMGSKVPKGSLVIAKNYSPSAENIGDAILCEGVGEKGTTILRLCNIVPNTETVIYQGFYDNEPKKIYNVPSDQLIGKALTYHVFLGAAISFVTSYKGMAVMVVVPLLILLLCELIIHLVGKSKPKNNIQKERFRKQLAQYKTPENSPLNPSKIGSHTSGPVTIEDFIFGREEQQTAKKSSTVEFKAEKTKQLEKSIEKAKAEKNAKAIAAAANAYKKAENETKPVQTVKETPVKLERVRVTKPIAEEKKPEPEVIAPKAEIKEEIKAEPEVKPEINETAAEKPEPVEKKEESAEEKITNSSLERLIKLMEEQEKLLKSLAEKE